MAFSKFTFDPSSKRGQHVINRSTQPHNHQTTTATATATASASATPLKRRQLRHLALSSLPALAWLLLFTSGVTLIPESAKPPINTTLLPFLDTHFFASSASWFPTNRSNPTLDLVAAVPYTLHPVLPFAYLLLLALHKEVASSVPRFVFSFGVLNLAAVSTHLACPTAPPWYYDKFGTRAANYSIRGDPAVLARVDRRFGLHMYEHMYVDVGKVVFGAWPSLHASWPYLIARLGLPPPLKWASFLVCAWVPFVWWAAIYLRHHFAADVVGGVLYAEGALLCYALVFSTCDFPHRMMGRFFRSKWRRNGRQTTAVGPNDKDKRMASYLPV